MSNISIYSNRKEIRLYFDDKLHLWLKKSELVSVQSWIQESTIENIASGFSGKNVFVIEYMTKLYPVKTEYGKREDWEEILHLLENHL